MGSDQRLKPLANERCNIMRFTVWKWLFRICHEQFLLLLLPQILFLSDGQVTHTMVSYVKHYTMSQYEVEIEVALVFLRASAHGAERVYGLYRQNQRDEGGGVSIIVGTFCEISLQKHLEVIETCHHRLLKHLSSNMRSEVT